jgi:hypothetical protein
VYGLDGAVDEGRMPPGATVEGRTAVDTEAVPPLPTDSTVIVASGM